MTKTPRKSLLTEPVPVSEPPQTEEKGVLLWGGAGGEGTGDILAFLNAVLDWI